MKACPDCHKRLPDTAFYPYRITSEAQAKYLSTRCKTCHNIKRDGNKLYQKYGITLEEYNVMLNRQAGVCAICHRPPRKRKLAVDHNHKTGKVRGLLCFSCNYGLPFFRESSTIFQSAVEYLKSNGE